MQSERERERKEQEGKGREREGGACASGALGRAAEREVERAHQRAVAPAESSGFRVQGSGFRVQGSGFRVQGAGFRVQGSGFRVQGQHAGAHRYGVIGEVPL